MDAAKKGTLISTAWKIMIQQNPAAPQQIQKPLHCRLLMAAHFSNSAQSQQASIVKKAEYAETGQYQKIVAICFKQNPAKPQPLAKKMPKIPQKMGNIHVSNPAKLV